MSTSLTMPRVVWTSRIWRARNGGGDGGGWSGDRGGWSGDRGGWSGDRGGAATAGAGEPATGAATAGAGDPQGRRQRQVPGSRATGTGGSGSLGAGSGGGGVGSTRCSAAPRVRRASGSASPAGACATCFCVAACDFRAAFAVERDEAADHDADDDEHDRRDDQLLDEHRRLERPSARDRRRTDKRLLFELLDRAALLEPVIGRDRVAGHVDRGRLVMRGRKRHRSEWIGSRLLRLERRGDR